MVSKKRGLLLLVVVMILGSLLVTGENARYGELDFGSQDVIGLSPDYCYNGISDGKPIEAALKIPPPFPDSGCYVYMNEEDTFDDGSCEGYADPGMQYYPYETNPTIFVDGSIYSMYLMGDWATLAAKWIAPNGNAYICEKGGWWVECSEDTLGSYLWIDNYLFNCTLHSDLSLPQWVPTSIDFDQDGYVNGPQDCYDNPAETSLQQEGCPVRDKKGVLDRECSLPADSTCVICINRAAPEVCGDEIDNDCNSLTPDDCNQNEYACTQNPSPSELEYSPNQKNVYDSSFAWINTQEGGYCCGYNGVLDLGKQIVSNQLENYLCVNDNLIGSEKKIAEWSGKIGIQDWYLLKATDLDAQFKVLTIKNPGAQPYDVLSDSSAWRVCNQTGPLDVSGDEVVDKYANAFYCYREGEHWSWAECYGTGISPVNQNVKGRKAGDGLYSLYLDKATINEKGEALVQASKITLSAEKGMYNDFYEISSSGGKLSTAKFDFSGYDQMEFFVRFVNQEERLTAGLNPDLPLNIKLTLYGPSGTDASGSELHEVAYVDQNVLGYSVSNSLFQPGSWTHIIVPLPSNLKAVSRVEISGIPYNENNQIQVKNVYLSNSGGVSPICSGKNSLSGNSWLTSFDGSTSGITGEEMCVSHFGEKAWLGDDSEVKVEEASCCGNTLHEYYSGSSRSGYGCWNSQPIAPDTTTNNIEVEVDYQDVLNTISYTPVNVKYDLKVTRKNTETSEVDTNNISPSISPNLITYEIKKVTSAEELNSKIPEKISDVWELQSVEIINVESNLQIYFFNTVTGELITGKLNPTLLSRGMRDYVILAEARQVNPLGQQVSSAHKLLNYPCNQDSCYFPLPGFPTYILSNPHPDLYQLYFISESGSTLLTKETKTFSEPGILQARQVAQQIIYINSDASIDLTEESSGTDQNFYGCEAPSYLEGTKSLLPQNNLPYCSIEANFFCSPSVIHEVGKEKYTTINSWSNESLFLVGYETPQEGAENATEFFANFKLQLKDADISSENRSYNSPLLPGRNFLSNANFAPNGEELPHWKILPSPNKLQEKIEERDTNSYVIKLSEGETLQSEKISVGHNLNLSFTQNSSCGYRILLVDKEGNPSEVMDKFNSGESSYLILEFFGPGEVFQPLLQAVDDLGMNSYNYDSDYSARAGAACCPKNHCWNGYACVEDMAEYTSLVESLGEQRFYRCVNGEWNHFPTKKDWTGDLEKWGFCPSLSQCFVLSSNYGASKLNIANDFYEGKYPTCINSSEYILDHYCDNGNWTSRTKFLADKLLEIVDQDSDYQLYCDDYQHSLLDYTTTENYLGGNIVQQVSGQTDDLLSGTVITSPVKNCFDQIMNGEGKRLVKDNENRHENTCVNNICVLKYKESGVDKVAFATSLNKPLTDSSSFLLALGVSQGSLNSVCPPDEGIVSNGFAQCDLGAVEGELWYAPDINAVIFARDGININPSWFSKTLTRIGEWVGGLFGTKSELSSEKRFVDEAQNYHQLYISNQDGKRIRAMQEYFSEEKQTLIVEYENYQTPMCNYLMNLKTPPELEVELFKEASGEGKLKCTTENEIQRVESIAGIDFLWSQMTASLRTRIE